MSQSSYSPQTSQELALLNVDQKKLFEQLRVCKLVKDLLADKGWKEIIQPSLDRMIAEEVGGKLGNRWIYGKIQKATSESKIWFHLGVKQGLMEFNNNIHNYVKMIDIIENQIVDIDKERKGEFETPMTESSFGIIYNKEPKVTPKKKTKKRGKKK